MGNAQKDFGTIRGKLLRRRLDEFAAAASLESIRLLPAAKCHELKGNLKGKLAVNLDQPYRLVFEPYNDPLPRKPDGGLDWAQVTAVRILEITNYHD